MRITFITDIGQSYVIEVDPQMELENIMALLEAEVGPRPPTPVRIDINDHLVWDTTTRTKYIIGRARFK